MSKRSKDCEFSPQVRKRIKERDNGCIFCLSFGNSGYPATQIAHYVSRGRSGLGVEQNGALVCVKHHQELDNGTNGAPMKAFFKSYLQNHYPGWNEEELIYSKWS